MKDWQWPLLLMITVVLCVIALPPQAGAFSGFRSDFTDPARPIPISPPTGKPLTDTVVLIVLDGLRYDLTQSAAMPFLAGLRSRAAWGSARAGLPSYSRPGYARLLTGAPAELTGMTMNEQTLPAPVPTIFSLARSVGCRTAAAAHHWVGELADGTKAGGKAGLVKGLNIQTAYYYLNTDPDARVFGAAKDFYRTEKPQLLMILPSSMDEVGHARGGGSAAYRKQAAVVDAELADFFYFLAGQRYLAIITSDHGHRNAGGHGGKEPEVLETPLFILGDNVRPGHLAPPIDQMDIAPTIAAALGLPMAGSMGGRVITEAFEDRLPWEARAETLRRTQRSFLSEYAPILGRRASGPEADFAAVWREARRSWLLHRFFLRLPVALLLLAAIGLAVRHFVHRLKWRWPMLAGAAYPLYFYALFRLVGYDYSYSAIVSAGDLAFKAALSALVSLFILTWAGAALRLGKGSFFQSTLLGAWTVQSALTVLAWLAVGGKPVRFLPDPGRQLFFMVQLLIAAIVAAYALIGWAAAPILRRGAAGRTLAGSGK